MTISPTPWTQGGKDGKELRDGHGNVIALFTDAADVTHVINLEAQLDHYRFAISKLEAVLDNIPNADTE